MSATLIVVLIKVAFINMPAAPKCRPPKLLHIQTFIQYDFTRNGCCYCCGIFTMMNSRLQGSCYAMHCGKS